jgi:uncharacterized membrane protein
MYVERDAKIILIYRSIIGIVFFTAFYSALAWNQQANPNSNFFMLQFMIFGIILILAAILFGSIISLKREISRQKDYLEQVSQKTAVESEKHVQVPYNKSGLYSLIVASFLGLIAFLYMYSVFVLSPQEYTNQNLETLSTMILVFVLLFIILLFASFYMLIKRIQTPLYYDMKACPRCNSTDIHRVEYSWWGGLVGPGLVHQVRCKKCGLAYDGASGTTITRRASIYITIVLIVSVILVILRMVY